MRRSLVSMFVLAWMSFSIQYRRTLLGPLWVLVAPSIFVVALGSLFGAIGQRTPKEFIPYLTVGVVIWSLIGGLIPKSATVFQRNRSHILNGSLALSEIIIQDVIVNFILFLHQIILIFIVIIYFQTPLEISLLLCLPALILIIVNCTWVTSVFGILGARFRDLAEIFQAVMRVAFLATPILWMPGERSGVFKYFTLYNPFYHFIEIFRAPLLGRPIEAVNWIIVVAITVIGVLLARYIHSRYARYVALWV